MYAWYSCMKLGLCVWTRRLNRHGCPGSGNILLQGLVSPFVLTEPTVSLRGDPELQAQSLTL